MDANCLFCKIGAKKIPAKLVLDEEEIFAFEDINPQAPTHILLCPRKHFASLHEASEGDAALLGQAADGGGEDCERTRFAGGVSHGVQQRERRGAVCVPFAPAFAGRTEFPLAPRIGAGASKYQHSISKEVACVFA